MNGLAGSSPRMRGSPPFRMCRGYSLGIIPAHAGLTMTCWLATCRARDHPRACGAHQLEEDRRTAPSGSSPRMRGSLHIRYIAGWLSGIIPAHAGLTFGKRRDIRIARDHPRACGAHDWRDEAREDYEGSSPRMRGSRMMQYPLANTLGIIPAHAGLTSYPIASNISLRDHPRACGAHGESVSHRRCVGGSSPRMRGSRIVDDGLRLCCGIIPAHAGLT